MNNTLKAIEPKINGVNKDLVLVLALQGKQPTEIGKIANCSASYASQLLKPIKSHINAYLAYKDRPEELYGFSEFMNMISINDKDRKDASLLQKTTSAGICRTKINEIKGIAPLDSTKLQFTVVYNDNRVINNSDDKTIDIIPEGY